MCYSRGDIVGFAKEQVHEGSAAARPMRAVRLKQVIDQAVEGIHSGCLFFCCGACNTSPLSWEQIPRMEVREDGLDAHRNSAMS
jgi:hypothetical protein